MIQDVEEYKLYVVKNSYVIVFFFIVFRSINSLKAIANYSNEDVANH
jgi:hypothetical protein